MTSDELLPSTQVPASLAIVGGGVIGCEFASVFNRLGSAGHGRSRCSTSCCPARTSAPGRTLQQAFKKAGIAVHVKTAVEAAERGVAGVTLRLAGGAEVTAARVLVAVGRRPVSAGLGYEEAGVEIDERGFVVTDESCRTTLRGGVRGRRRRRARRSSRTGPTTRAPSPPRTRSPAPRWTATAALVPSCVVQLAGGGVLRPHRGPGERPRASTHEVAHVRFNGNSKAVCDGDAEGFVRIVCEPGGGRVLGASLVGPHVTELVHELALAAHAGLTLADVAGTIHAHPTLSEAVGEAALGGLGRGVHSL